MVNYIGIEGDYYKYASKNGFDRPTETINYRANIGKYVQAPKARPPYRLMSDMVLHAYPTASALIGYSADPAKKPADDAQDGHSFYRIHGTPVSQLGRDPQIAQLGFVGFTVVEELTWQQLLSIQKNELSQWSQHKGVKLASHGWHGFC
jgi:hypothetical protein